MRIYGIYTQSSVRAQAGGIGWGRWSYKSMTNKDCADYATDSERKAVGQKKAGRVNELRAVWEYARFRVDDCVEGRME